MRRRRRLAILVAGLALLGIVLLVTGLTLAVRGVRRSWFRSFAPQPAEGYLFCVWNAENLFDDRDDPLFRDDLEDWFGRNPAALQQKTKLLVDTLLRLNRGRGPDILALVEVENRRAIELLRLALNARLPEGLDYPAAGLVHRDNRSGRRVEPAVLTRLPVREAGRDDFGTRRILAARIEGPDGSPLLVLASHWTSRVGGPETVAKRKSYAGVLYRAFLDAFQHDSAADVVICGDFNDEPNDPSVRSTLRAIGDPARVLSESQRSRPFLLNLMAGRDPRVDGTYMFRGSWRILDHIVVSPGMLDAQGWKVVPNSLQVVNDARLRGGTKRGPRRFGNPINPNRRGPSDHFAVTVRLAVPDGSTSP